MFPTALSLVDGPSTGVTHAAGGASVSYSVFLTYLLICDVRLFLLGLLVSSRMDLGLPIYDPFGD